MSAFIEWLESLNKKDTKVRAVLRRSLAFDPGEYRDAFPYVERFLGGDEHSWRRRTHYLTAALWATHWKEGLDGNPLSIGKACGAFDGEQRKLLSPGDRDKLTSMERRFITLLDADADQLPHRLRQMVALLKDQPLDYAVLLDDLLHWNDTNKRTQNQWAKDFYRALKSTAPLPNSNSAEESQP